MAVTATFLCHSLGDIWKDLLRMCTLTCSWILCIQASSFSPHDFSFCPSSTVISCVSGCSAKFTCL